MSDRTDKDKHHAPSLPEMLRALVSGAGGESRLAGKAPLDHEPVAEPERSVLRVRVASRSAEKAIDVAELFRSVAAAATATWKIQSRIDREQREKGYEAPKWLVRQLEAASDSLHALGVEVKDHSGEKYVPGLAVTVVAFQPKAGITFDVITETLKPSIFFKGALIQPGEVVVSTPQAEATESGEAATPTA